MYDNEAPSGFMGSGKMEAWRTGGREQWSGGILYVGNTFCYLPLLQREEFAEVETILSPSQGFYFACLIMTGNVKIPFWPGANFQFFLTNSTAAAVAL
jgi:hypothetical protein